MLRFSLLTLLGVVLVAAVFCAALVNPTALFARVIVSLTFVILLSSMLMAAILRRQFPFGFAMVGSAYFLLVFLDSILFVTSFKDLVLTEWIVEESAVALHDEFGEAGTFERAAEQFLAEEGRSRENFGHIGHSLWTLLLATLGGLFASWLARRRDGAKPKASG